MQSKGMNYLLIIVMVVLIIGFFYWQTIPSPKPVSKTVVFNADVLDSNVVKTIKSKKSYGNLPVTVGAGEAGKQDPFSGL
ncbi:MAG: hypothetical protein CEN92_405 [Candidatus Berkelbacteria bacterium Licking1014_96]|uniref:Uncharacterized protein n=1 Tax=Candidatus Berkelbacteria bacterium Licking1014_96 TaxID=2017149 RepID=A0A554LD15_9BACT|nr:MAG: hypothetical protein CEN92_405 [Candidatus Berkelbacteria bacterium Licking1014_96]